MCQSNVYEMLKETGVEVFYNHIDNPSKAGLPWLVYFRDKSQVRGSDFANHIKETEYIIELYTNMKDLETENKVEEILNKYGISYETTETYIKEENMYLVAYYIQIIEKI